MNGDLESLIEQKATAVLIAPVNEWSDKNGNLSPEEITYKNRSNVWWHCSKCGNEYQAVVYARANGRICPFCIALVRL